MTTRNIVLDQPSRDTMDQLSRDTMDQLSRDTMDQAGLDMLNVARHAQRGQTCSTWPNMVKLARTRLNRGLNQEGLVRAVINESEQ